MSAFTLEGDAVEALIIAAWEAEGRSKSSTTSVRIRPPAPGTLF